MAASLGGLISRTVVFEYFGRAVDSAEQFDHRFTADFQKPADLAGIEVPERAEYIRVLVCELQRIASHMMAIGSAACGPS